MSEIIFKNKFGEYRVGDKIYVVASSYGIPINIYKAILLAKDESGRLKVEGEFSDTTFRCEDGNPSDYNYVVDGRLTYEYNDEGQATRAVAENGRAFIWVPYTYTAKRTLQLNRVMPRVE